MQDSRGAVLYRRCKAAGVPFEDGMSWASLLQAGVDLDGVPWLDLWNSRARVRMEGVPLREIVAAGVVLARHYRSSLQDAGVDLRGVSWEELRAEGVLVFASEVSRQKLPSLPADVPVVPDLHRRMADAVGARGERLRMQNWHSDCITTHCRAGWAVVLAGEAGRTLERRYNTAEAAAMIYLASDPTLTEVPDWHCDNDEALRDIRDCAERAGNCG